MGELTPGQRDGREGERGLALLRVVLAGLIAASLSIGAVRAGGEVAAIHLEQQVERCWRAAVEDPTAAAVQVAKDLAAAEALEVDAAAARQLAHLRLCRGYVQEQLGQIDLAGEDYERAVEAGERSGDRELLAVALVLRGELAYYRGAFDAAVADLDRGYRLEVELERPGRQRYALNAMANLYSDPRVGAYDKAIEYYRKILAAHEGSGALREQATAHFNLGSTLERKGELAAALAAFDRAAAIDRSRADADAVAVDDRAAAALLVKLGRSREALLRIDPVVAHFARSGDEETLAQARLTRGIARRALGDMEGALLDLDASAERFRLGNNDRYLARIEEERAEVLAASGKFEDAFRARSAQTALERRLAEMARDEQTSRLRIQFDTERKEAENRALERESELKGRALADAERIRGLQRAVIALGALLLALAIGLAARQLRRARHLHLLAMTDELTRLPNRRAFFARAGAELAAARRAGGTLSLLALDVDHFKRINDHHGHDSGDRVLQRVAHAARVALREGDLVGRTGGEEFLALLPRAPMALAAEVAERLRAAVALLDTSDLAPDLRVTVSVGVAELGAGEAGIECLARRADEALYRAKSAGRNRVELASAAAS